MMWNGQKKGVVGTLFDIENIPYFSKNAFWMQVLGILMEFSSEEQIYSFLVLVRRKF